MRGLLVRVGIDISEKSGGWNAPVDMRTRRFIFVPIRDEGYNRCGEYIDEGRRVYGEEVAPALKKFAHECQREESRCFQLPKRLNGNVAMHLDPDFKYLTYGDDLPRGWNLILHGDWPGLEEDDFLAFYSSFRNIHEPDKPGGLVYALIGLFVLQSPPIVYRPGHPIPHDERLQNAHTRWKAWDKDQIVVHARGSVWPI